VSSGNGQSVQIASLPHPVSDADSWPEGAKPSPRTKPTSVIHRANPLVRFYAGHIKPLVRKSLGTHTRAGGSNAAQIFGLLLKNKVMVKLDCSIAIPQT
jgi:hypothetical protein